MAACRRVLRKMCRRPSNAGGRCAGGHRLASSAVRDPLCTSHPVMLAPTTRPTRGRAGPAACGAQRSRRRFAQRAARSGDGERALRRALRRRSLALLHAGSTPGDPASLLTPSRPQSASYAAPYKGRHTPQVQGEEASHAMWPRQKPNSSPPPALTRGRPSPLVASRHSTSRRRNRSSPPLRRPTPARAAAPRPGSCRLSLLLLFAALLSVAPSRLAAAAATVSTSSSTLRLYTRTARNGGSSPSTVSPLLP